MPENTPFFSRPFPRYGAAVVAVGTAFCVRQALAGCFGGAFPPYVTFYPAIVLVAVFAGLGPGLLATAASALLAAYWILPPAGQFAIASASDTVAFVFFAAMGVLICLAAEQYRRAREHSVVLATELARQAEQFRARAENERGLRQAKEEWERTFDSVPDLIAILDNNQRIVRVNKAMAERLADSPDGLAGLPCYQCVHGTDCPPAACPHARSVKDGQTHAAELREEHLGGDFLVTTTPLFDAAGQVVGSVHVARDITEQKQAEAALRESHDLLEQRVNQRTAALLQAVRQLEEQSRQVRALALELTRTEQRERKQLAELLHDGLQQVLVAANLRLALLSRSDDPQVKSACEEAKSLIAETIQQSRTLTAELSPPILRSAGLVPALEWLARHMQQKYDLTVHLQVDARGLSETDNVKLVLFRSVRELLFNVVKHSRVQGAHVEVRRDNGAIHVHVSDAGAGFTPATVLTGSKGDGGFGLASIRQRLELLGGQMMVESSPGLGSRFRLVAPAADESTSREGERQ